MTGSELKGKMYKDLPKAHEHDYFPFMEDVHLAQAINYLEAYNLHIGLLINFGAGSLEFKRVRNKKLS